jgi:hypothetical protein
VGERQIHVLAFYFGRRTTRLEVGAEWAAA